MKQGLAFGPLVAGALIQGFGWQAVFLTTAALGTLALVFGVPRIRETRDPHATGLDWPGTVLFTATLASFTFGVIQAPASGWRSPLVLALLGASLLAWLCFVFVELRVKRPMLDLSLFKYMRFVGVQMLPIGTCYSFIVLVVMLPLRFIGVEHMGELEAGLTMVALSVPVAVVPFIAAALTRWVSAGTLCGIGFLVAAAGLHWLSHAHAGGPVHDLTLPMLLIGLGSGLPWGLMDALAVSAVPTERAGMAAGIFNTARVAGEGVTLAIVGAVLAALAQDRLLRHLRMLDADVAARVAEAAQRLTAGGLEAAVRLVPELTEQALVEGYDQAFRGLVQVLTAVTLLAAVCAFVSLRQPRQRGRGATAQPARDAADQPSTFPS